MLQICIYDHVEGSQAATCYRFPLKKKKPINSARGFIARTITMTIKPHYIYTDSPETEINGNDKDTSRSRVPSRWGA